MDHGLSVYRCNGGSWTLGRYIGRVSPSVPGDDSAGKFTDARLAVLGLLLAFSFAMASGRHDDRRLKVIEESNAIGDFYTCASLLEEPHRSALQATIRSYVGNEMRLLSRFRSEDERNEIIARALRFHTQMTNEVALALRAGTPIAINLTNTLNVVTSANAARIAAYRESLPWSVQLLLVIAGCVPAFLTGRQQGSAKQSSVLPSLSFILLVSLVVYITLDLNQGRRGLITVNTESFERLADSIGAKSN